MKPRREYLLIAAVVMIGAGLMYYGIARRGPATTADTRLRITSQPQGGEKDISVLPLDDDVHKTVDVAGPLGTTVVEVDGLRAHVIASPCPDKLCIKMGWLERPGEYAACLPNRVLAEMLGSDSARAY